MFQAPGGQEGADQPEQRRPQLRIRYPGDQFFGLLQLVRSGGGQGRRHAARRVGAVAQGTLLEGEFPQLFPLGVLTQPLQNVGFQVEKLAGPDRGVDAHGQRTAVQPDHLGVCGQLRSHRPAPERPQPVRPGARVVQQVFEQTLDHPAHGGWARGCVAVGHGAIFRGFRSLFNPCFRSASDGCRLELPGAILDTMNPELVLALQQALALIQSNRHREAEAVCARLLADHAGSRDSRFADLWFIAAMAVHHLHDDITALARIDRAIVMNPACGDYHLNRGVILLELDRVDAAEAAFRRTIVLGGGARVEAEKTLGRLLVRTGRAGEALAAFRSALAAAPDDPELLGDLGVVLVALRQVDAALSCYRRSLEIRPDDADVRFNYSRALLLAGEYAEGWRQNEWRWLSSHYAKLDVHLPYPVWDGEPLAGRRILLIGEQGFGDTLQLVRYVRAVQRRGGRVAIQCRRELVRLLAAMPGVMAVTALGDPPPSAECCLPMFSLPLRFDTRLETVPADLPCLAAPPGIALSEPLTQTDGLRVGLAWSGTNQRVRRLRDFSPLLELPGVEFFTVQPGIDADELDGLPIRDPGRSMGDFADTAAVMAQLDLIISIDTAAAHLAGAMGRPLWVILHPTADWRWGLSGERSPWYPAARLFRQQRGDGWPSVLAELEVALREVLARHGGSRGG